MARYLVWVAFMVLVMTTPASTQTALVRTGADVLVDSGFSALAGKRIGLITNPTGRARGQHLIDHFASSRSVRLVALFAPEHGLRGDQEAGAEIRDGRDTRTGLPVYSLHGKTRTPTPAMLHGIDVLVFDIQDVGARFYTYTSTMGLAMQAAARAGIRFMVLDRPNPLGGERVAGFMMQPRHTSFVGLYPVPMVHGLTAGELAQMIKGEAMLPGLERLNLDVIQMQGWQRHMQWPDTRLEWTPPSPNIPDYLTALVYPGTVLFEATRASEGRGTRAPFLQVGGPGINSRQLAATLNARRLRGVTFEAVQFTPRPIKAMAPNPKLKGRRLGGVRVKVTDTRAFEPVLTGVHILEAFFRATGRRLISRPGWLARLTGSERLYRGLLRRQRPDDIVNGWRGDVQQFKALRQRYLLY